MSKVAIFIGSSSDESIGLKCADLLSELGISYEIAIASAHRTPERVADLMNKLESSGCSVYICMAGMAAHLAGAVAAKTIRPVIGVPITASSLNGIDALLSTVMMPSGFPVATVALDKAGASNAAWLAAQILAISDSSIAQKIKEARNNFKVKVEEASDKLTSKLNSKK